jgi:hypothetical protein
MLLYELVDRADFGTDGMVVLIEVNGIRYNVKTSQIEVPASDQGLAPSFILVAAEE